MNNQEKIRIIAEKIMGYDNFEAGFLPAGEVFSPYESVTDYLEVLRKLTPEQKDAVMTYIFKYDKFGYIIEPDLDIDMTLWLTDPANIPKVLDCLVELLTPTGETQ